MQSVTGGATVVGRQIFYANSAYDNPAAGLTADNAIAPDKQALLPGQQATFINYTSYSKGINGIIIDISGLADPAHLTLADLQFRVGNNSNPASWSIARAPSSVTVRQGAGKYGSDRITIYWPNGSTVNQWMQITVKASTVTGLTQPDVFYFGNTIGETGNNFANAVVDSTDRIAVMAHLTGVVPTTITNPYDFDRDRIVNGNELFYTQMYSYSTNQLLLISPAISATAVSVSSAAPLSGSVQPAAALPNDAGMSRVDSTAFAISPAVNIDKVTPPVPRMCNHRSHNITRGISNNGFAGDETLILSRVLLNRNAHDAALGEIDVDGWSTFND
jgi:hypothetical protein